MALHVQAESSYMKRVRHQVSFFQFLFGPFLLGSIPARLHRTAGGEFYTCADTKHKKDG